MSAVKATEKMMKDEKEAERQVRIPSIWELCLYFYSFKEDRVGLTVV